MLLLHVFFKYNKSCIHKPGALDSHARGSADRRDVWPGHGITRYYEPETTESPGADNQYKDVCQAVYRRIVYDRDGVFNTDISFSSSPC